jgi:hypothetical protein
MDSQKAALGPSFPRVMKFSRDSLPDRTGPFTTALARMFRATEAGSTRSSSFSLALSLGPFASCCLPRGWVRRLPSLSKHRDPCGALVRLPLVHGSDRCGANGPDEIIDGFGRVPAADVG